MFAAIGGAVGFYFCLFSLVFRWRLVVAKYGSLSLFWWILAVTVASTIAGYLMDLAVFGLRYAAWWILR